MGVDRFEDFHAWQKARELTRAVYEATRGDEVSRDYGYCNQIRRAAISAMSNVAEGFERARPREFHQFLSVGKASVAEVKSLVYAGRDIGYLNDEQYEQIMIQIRETANLIGALRASVERRLNAAQNGKRSISELSAVPEHPAPSTQHSTDPVR